MAVVLLIDMVTPIALYYLLRALGMAAFLALLLSSVTPGVSFAYQFLRHRRLDSLGLFMIAVTVVSAIGSVVSGNPRFLLAKDALITTMTGIVLLANTRARRPVVSLFARALLDGKVGPAGMSWDDLWERLPRFRRIWRIASVIWGSATLLDACARFVFAYGLPVDVVPLLNGALYAAMFACLQVITNIYYFRAGLFHPGSPLYEPVRPMPAMHRP